MGCDMTDGGLASAKEAAMRYQGDMADNNLAAAKEAAMRYLGYRMRTRREMEKYLQKKGFDDSAISGAISMLTEYKYIDDLAFARQYIASCLRFNKWGMKKIKYELSLKGVSPDISDAAAADADYPASEMILNLAEKKLKRPTEGLDAAERKKLFTYLLNRGFSYDEIYSALTF